jgi:hypothetical protein
MKPADFRTMDPQALLEETGAAYWEHLAAIAWLSHEAQGRGALCGCFPEVADALAVGGPVPVPLVYIAPPLPGPAGRAIERYQPGMQAVFVFLAGETIQAALEARANGAEPLVVGLTVASGVPTPPEAARRLTR